MSGFVSKFSNRRRSPGSLALRHTRNGRRNHPMLQRSFVAVPTAIAVVLLVVGCAGPTASSVSRPAASALAPPSELAGTWAGTLGASGASSSDERKCVVQIAEDDTFTATCEPNGGADNVAKVSTSSGTVVIRGHRVTFRTSQGQGVTLVRSDNTLYGMTKDPSTGRTVLIKLERA